MSYENFMKKVRYWDTLTAKWILRHFYFTFFQIVLVVIFLFWFINFFSVIDLQSQSHGSSPLERLLITQSTNISIITLLLILNTFWVLFIFNTLQRFRTLIKDISFHLSKLRNRDFQSPRPNIPPERK